MKLHSKCVLIVLFYILKNAGKSLYFFKKFHKKNPLLLYFQCSVYEARVDHRKAINVSFFTRITDGQCYCPYTIVCIAIAPDQTNKYCHTNKIPEWF